MLPIAIRLAVLAWQRLQPYRSVFRTAAMFLLMVVGSTAMMLVVGQGLRSRNKPAAATAVAVDRAVPGPDERAAELEPVLRAEDQGDASTTLVAPSALGPAASASRPTYERQPPTADPSTIEPIEAQGHEMTEPNGKSVGQNDMDGREAASGEFSEPFVAPDDYPTTSYPLPALPPTRIGLLPRVQIAEPSPAVARLRGDIQDPQTR